jgi:argininosuccinate lyase
MLDRAAEETLGRALGIGDETVQASLDFRSYIQSLQSSGSAKPAEVSRAVSDERRRQAEHGGWLTEKHEQLRAAERELASSVERLVVGAG